MKSWLLVISAIVLMTGFFLWSEKSRDAVVRKTEDVRTEGTTADTPTHVRLRTGKPSVNAIERNFVVLDDEGRAPAAIDTAEKYLTVLRLPENHDRNQKADQIRSRLKISSNGYSLLAQALNQRLGNREEHAEATEILRLMAEFTDRDAETIAMAKAVIRQTDSPEASSSASASDAAAMRLPITATQTLIQKIPTLQAAQIAVLEAMTRHQNRDVRAAMAKAFISKYPDAAPELRRQLAGQEIQDVEF